MVTTDSATGALPAGAGPAEPPVSAEEQGAGRRKKLLLLLLLLILLVLTLVSAWYLVTRKPITELTSPLIDNPMPTYQASLYNLSKPQSVAVTADGSRLVVTQTGTSLDTVLMDRQGTKLAVLKPPTNLVPQAHQLFAALDPVTGQLWIF